jgi:hypothetical protein
MEMPDELYSRVYDHLVLLNPTIALHTHNVPPPSAQSIQFSNKAIYFDYIILKRQRYYAAERAKSSAESLVAIHTRQRIWVGKLKHIFKLKQDGVSGGVKCFGDVQWFKPCSPDDVPDSWSAL